MTIQSAIERFRAAAIAKGDFAEPKKDAELHQAMTDAIVFIESQKEGAEAMRILLSDSQKEVQSWIAAHLLSKGDSSARDVLKKIATGSGLVAFSASMTLTEHEKGRLHSPFLYEKKKRSLTRR